MLNKNKRREYKAAYRQRNLNKIRRNNREKIGTKYRQRRLNALAVLGGICVRCGFSDSRALVIDHINGDGNKHRIHGSHGPVNDIFKGIIEPYQLLCANCNSIKRVEFGENGGRPRLNSGAERVELEYKS